MWLFVPSSFLPMRLTMPWFSFASSLVCELMVKGLLLGSFQWFDHHLLKIVIVIDGTTNYLPARSRLNISPTSHQTLSVKTFMFGRLPYMKMAGQEPLGACVGQASEC
ncbi:hypothetical protein RRG08_067422 [Elysia crispata]|uniref:Uncharacterized protein n=1 Tax=Elysia crispata TaxID=231223 RepID=A0AAE1A2W0_9GAST|nr:hypothetical protein RRG08_067422 [Elysia crispata]